MLPNHQTKDKICQNHPWLASKFPDGKGLTINNQPGQRFRSSSAGWNDGSQADSMA